MELTGKRLLVLGGNNSTYGIVKCAKEMGLYVICVGLEETGSAKELADESYTISTNDMEALSRLIDEKNIDGVFTGASEFNCQNMIKLTHMKNLPCYCDAALWDLMQNKRHFKDACKKYGVHVIPEYTPSADCADIVFPVIVKPTDSCSAQGISACFEPSQLQNALDFAYQYSASKTAIVERYMQCDSVSSCYTIQDGKISFSHIVDWYRYKNPNGIETITASLIFPSRYLAKYIETADKPIRDMIAGVGLRNGFIEFQMFVENDIFYVFECCLRIPGSYDYPIMAKLNGINYLEMMIEYAVTGASVRYDGPSQNDPSFGGKWAANVAIMLNEGTIAAVSGVEDVMANESIISMTTPPEVGHTVTKEAIGTLLQTFCRYNVIGNTKQELLENIQFIFQTLEVTDTDGNAMICPPIDYSVI